LDYFNIVALISSWGPGSLFYFSTMVHTYPWDPGIWLYTLIMSVGDKDILRGMECSVDIGVVGRDVGGGGASIVIIVKAIQCKVD
jgi:hypothetical protein